MTTSVTPSIEGKAKPSQGIDWLAFMGYEAEPRPAQTYSLPEGFELDEPEIVPPGGIDHPKPIDDTPPESQPTKADLDDLGKEDKESGRKVVQPFDDAEEAQRLATQATPELKDKLQEITHGIPGAKFERLRPQKSMDRTEEKVEDGKPPETVKDYLAAQIAADTVEAKQKLVAAIREKFKVLEFEDSFLKGRRDLAGYPSTNLQVQMENGSSAEVQIVPTEVLNRIIESHRHYEAGREAEEQSDNQTRDREFAKAAQINREGLEAFKARNREAEAMPVTREQISKGDTVTLRDGSEAKVQYIHPNLNLARVKVDGKTRIVNFSEVQPAYV